VNKKTVKIALLLVILLSIFVMSIPEAMAQSRHSSRNDTNYRRVHVPPHERGKVNNFRKHDGSYDRGRIERHIGNHNVQRAHYYSQRSRVNMMDIMMLYLVFRNWDRVALHIGYTPVPTVPVYQPVPHPGYYAPAPHPGYYAPVPHPGYYAPAPTYYPTTPVYRQVRPVFSPTIVIR
jgi:hypothetical protein